MVGKVTRFYFVRHVQALGNVQKRFQGVTDNEITKDGETQLENVASFFKDKQINKIYTSPLIRAVKTAKAIETVSEAQIETSQLIKEIFVGPWENMPLEQIKAGWPQQFENWGSAPWKFNVEGAETMVQVFERCSKFVAEIKKTCTGQNVAIVAHGGVMKSLICASLNRPITRLTDIGWISNGGVSLVEFSTSGEGSLEYVNEYSHIAPETVLIPTYAKLPKKGEEK